MLLNAKYNKVYSTIFNFPFLIPTHCDQICINCQYKVNPNYSNTKFFFELKSTFDKLRLNRLRIFINYVKDFGNPLQFILERILFL